MIPRDPEDGPSCAEECCDIGGCSEPWADTVDRDNGPRKLQLCERHHDEWTRGESALRAESEDIAGREDVTNMAPFYALARTFLDGRTKRRRRSA